MAFQPQNDLNVNYLDFLIQELDSQELDLNFSSHESVDDINLIQDSHQNLNHSVDYTLMIQGDQDVLTQFDEQTKESHEFERFEYVIRPWKQEALEYLKNKHPQIYLKNSALAAAVVIKFLRTRLILTNSRNMQMATNAGTQVSSNLVKASEVIVEKMTRQPDQISQQVAQVTSLDVLRESVKASGGNVQSSVKIFKDSITNKTTWAITAAIFVSEVAVLTWQRFVSNSIDTQTYKDRVKASFLSNTAGVIGGSMGACIGSLIGNLIAPGVGGFVGSLLGGLFASVGSQILVDQYFDSKSYSLEEYEKYEISDEMKYESYLKACEKIQIPAGATKAQIEQQTKIQYLRFHPDKHSDKNPQDQEFYKTMFIEIRLSYIFIKQYRNEKGTWRD
eukprot:403346070